MPTSMTGHGCATFSADGVTITIELRSVNHRHLDVRFRPSTGVPTLEAELKARLRAKVERGHIDVRIHADASGSEDAVRLDLPRARAYYRAGQRIGTDLGVDDRLTARDLLAMPGVLETAPAHTVLAARSEATVAAFDRAVDELLESRGKEGVRLQADLRARVAALQSIHAAITALSGGQLDARREQLRARVTDAVAAVGARLDEGRLEQELVHIADRSDVTEELVRLNAHLETFASTLTLNEPIGRKLGFVCQEILREINTTGSKSHLLAITEHVVAAKIEVEKCREQVLNLE